MREQRRFTSEEYLAFERQARFRHEFIDGGIYKIGGWDIAHDSPSNHDAIVSSTLAALVMKTKNFGCEAHSSLDRSRQLYEQQINVPDITLTYGSGDLPGANEAPQQNPTLIAEVLSDSTEKYDRGKKFEHYRQIDSLREYLLISQDRPHVELFTRDAGGQWTLSEATGLDAAINLPAIGSRLALADVYAKVSWATP